MVVDPDVNVDFDGDGDGDLDVAARALADGADCRSCERYERRRVSGHVAVNVHVKVYVHEALSVDDWSPVSLGW